MHSSQVRDEYLNCQLGALGRKACILRLGGGGLGPTGRVGAAHALALAQDEAISPARLKQSFRGGASEEAVRGGVERRYQHRCVLS